MKKKNRNGFGAVLPILALALWVLALFFAQRMGALSRDVAVRWEENGPSPSQILQAERRAMEDGRTDMPALSLWRETAGETLWDAAEDRSTPITVLEGYGAGDAIYPAAFLFGGYPARGDTQGIALDMAAANALWGGPGAPGQRVRWNAKNYALRGVFAGKDGLAFVQDADESAQSYENLLLRLSDGGVEQAELFLNSAGLSGGVSTDLPFWAWCVSALAGLPGILLVVTLLLRLISRGWQLRTSPLLLGQYLPFALGAAALTLLAAGWPWKIRAKLIPTRWSDLEFWSRLFSELSESLRALITHALSRRDVALWLPAAACLITILIACALTLVSLRRLRARSLVAVFTHGLAAMGTVFFMVFALRESGGVTPTRAAWLLPTVWLATDLALRGHAAHILPKNERRDEIAANTAQTENRAALGTD